MHRLLVVLLATTCLLLEAQIGGPYPDPTEGPGRRFPTPRSTPSGIPWPRHKKGDSTNGEQLKTTAGRIRAVSGKAITIDTDDGRVIAFNRGAKTRVIEQGKERRVSDLRPGDVVSIDATEDSDGYFYAHDIRVTGHAAQPANRGNTAQPDSSQNRSPIPSVETLPPVIGDTGTDEAPRLRRGAHPQPDHNEDIEGSTEQAANVPHAAAAAPVEPNEDPIITKARRASSAFTERLPNYLCTEYMTRYQSDTRPVNWQPLDVVSTEVVYQDGKEDYRKVSVNGKQTKKAITELGGSWSTGEFATILVDLFSPSSQASFFFRGESASSGIAARIYDFRVEKANSHWHVQVAGQWVLPAYKGSIWIDPKAGRVLRIEMQAAYLPDEFPLDQVESAVDYEPVRLGAGKYLLPVHAENLACQRFSLECSRSAIDFRNYHVFGSDTAIQYGDAAAH
ncbi:MAG: hypothetical protein IT160_20195 [Bryobacterales bacterium]|nr:hypothetical protein [Bryobacterales bacterium]